MQGHLWHYKCNNKEMHVNLPCIVKDTVAKRQIEEAHQKSMDLCCLVSCHSCQLFHVSDFVVHALLFVGCILSLASESSLIVIILGFCMRAFFQIS